MGKRLVVDDGLARRIGVAGADDPAHLANLGAGLGHALGEGHILLGRDLRPADELPFVGVGRTGRVAVGRIVLAEEIVAVGIGARHREVLPRVGHRIVAVLLHIAAVGKLHVGVGATHVDKHPQLVLDGAVCCRLGSVHGHAHRARLEHEVALVFLLVVLFVLNKLVALPGHVVVVIVAVIGPNGSGGGSAVDGDLAGVGALEVDAPGTDLRAVVGEVVIALGGLGDLAGHRVRQLELVGARDLPHAALHVLDVRRHLAHRHGRVAPRGVLVALGAQGPQGHLPINDETVHRRTGVDGLGHPQVVVARLGGIGGAGIVGGDAHHAGVHAHRGRGLADGEHAGSGGHVALGQRRADVLLARLLVAAGVHAVLVVVHSRNDVQGVRILARVRVIDQRRLVGPLEILRALVIEATHAIDTGRILLHRGAQIQCALLQGYGLLVGTRRIGEGRVLREAVGTVEHVARAVGDRLVQLLVFGDGDRSSLARPAMAPARFLGQPRHVAILGSEIGLRGLRGPLAHKLLLLVVGQKLAVLVGEIRQGGFLIAHIVDAGTHLQRHGIAGAQIAIRAHVVPESREQAFVLQEFGVVGVVRRRQLEDDGLAGAGATLHVGGIHGIVRVVPIGLAVFAVLVGGAGGESPVGVLVVVRLHAHAHCPTLLDELLGREALVLLLLLLALRVHRRTSDGVFHSAGVGMAITIGMLHIEGVIITLVIAEQLLEVGRRDHLAQIHELLLVVEGHLLGQIHREHQLGVLQRALLALLPRSVLVGDNGVAERGREPHLVVVLESTLLRLRLVARKQRAVSSAGQRQGGRGGQVAPGDGLLGIGQRRLVRGTGRRRVLDFVGRP